MCARRVLSLRMIKLIRLYITVTMSNILERLSVANPCFFLLTSCRKFCQFPVRYSQICVQEFFDLTYIYKTDFSSIFNKRLRYCPKALCSSFEKSNHLTPVVIENYTRLAY